MMNWNGTDSDEYGKAQKKIVSTHHFNDKGEVTNNSLVLQTPPKPLRKQWCQLQQRVMY